MSDATTDALRVAANKELLQDLIQRLHRSGRTIDREGFEQLRTESVRAFLATLILDGRVTHDEAEAYCLDYQVQRLNAQAREPRTARKR